MSYIRRASPDVVIENLHKKQEYEDYARFSMMFCNTMANMPDEDLVAFAQWLEKRSDYYFERGTDEYEVFDILAIMLHQLCYDKEKLWNTEEDASNGAT